jgi:uncharacterized membrane protein
MQMITQFFGRFHPLLVHLPIGMLFLAGVFEFLSYFPRYKRLRQSVQPTLFWGALFAIAAAISGYFLSQEGGYDDRILSLHRNTGIATAIFSTLLYFLRKSAITFFDDKGKRKLVRIFLFIPLIGVLSLTGHLGGSLTHGEDYLFGFLDEQSEAIAPAFKIASSENVDSAVFYKDIIEPILNTRCYSCHSSKKQKGQLRLDEIQFIEKGGKHGAVIRDDLPDSSTLYSRLMLPLEDEHHMPPNEKPQLASAEIALIQVWIEEGADFERQVFGFKQISRIKGYLSSMLSGSGKEALVPAEAVSVPDKKSIDALTSKGILVIPVGSGSNYLSVSFVNFRNATDEELSLLLPLKEQILWLNLGRTNVTGDGLNVVSQLKNLTQLNLEYTGVEGTGLKDLTSLLKLNTLNLVGTKVDDQSLIHFSQLKSLKKIYLYQTNTTAKGIQDFKVKLPETDIDTGSYQLPKLVTDTLIFKGKP